MYAPAYPHDEIKTLYPDIYLLHGSIRMGPGMRMNRNMIILKNERELTLINPVRMNDAGLEELDKLGNVKHIIRLGDFHGLDDVFYLDRYQCEFWAQQGQSTYKTPTPTRLISSDAESPYPNSRFFTFESATYPEAALLINDHRLIIMADSIQYHADWSYFSWFTKLVFKAMGFKVGMNIGLPWLKRVTPKGKTMKHDFEELLNLEFDTLIAAHGLLSKENTKALLKLEIDRIFK